MGSLSRRMFSLAAAVMLPAVVQAQVSQLAFVPGETSNNVRVVRVSDMTTQALHAVGGSPRATAVSPDGRFLFVANYGGGDNISIVDAITGTSSGSIANTPTAQGLAVSPDGHWLYATISGMGEVAVFDATTLTPVTTIPVGNGPMPIVFHPDGTKAYVGNTTDETVSVIDTDTRTVTSTIAIGGQGSHMAITPDGSKLYVALTGGTMMEAVRVIDLDTEDATGLIPLTGQSLTGLAMRPDGARLFVTTSSLFQFNVIDTATDTVVATPSAPYVNSGVSVSRDGSRLYVVLLDGHLIEYDAVTYAQLSGVDLGITAPWPTGPFLGPNYLHGQLSIDSDTDLDSYWPGSSPVNLNGGTLRLTDNWTSTRVLSVLAGGGTIDTNGFDAAGFVIGNNGVLTKTGAGVLTITQPSHINGTIVSGGALMLAAPASHVGPITVSGNATLYGTGSAPSVTVTGNAQVQPGAPGLGQTGILHISDVTFGAGTRFVVDINSSTAGSGYDVLDVDGTATVDPAAELIVRLFYNPAPGTQFVLLENPSGPFDAQPEGSWLLAGGQAFRVSYLGGDGNDLVLTADDPPAGGAISAHTVVENRVLGPLSLTISDDLTAAASLTVTGTSSNQSIVADANIAITGSGSPRSVTITPVDSANGQVTITLTVSDGFNETPVQFTLDVTPDHDPTITGPANQSITRDTVLGPLAFTIGDDYTNASALTITRASSNTSVVSNAGVVATGTGASRQVTITPLPGQTGQTTITLTVEDQLGQTKQATFTVDVTPDDPPTITGPANQQQKGDAVIGPLEFTVGDDLLALAQLTVTATSSNQAVVRDQDLALGGGSGATRTLTLTPMADAIGITTITLKVEDERSSATHTFTVELQAPELTYYLAEGATGAFFDTDLLIANPQDVAVPVTIEFLRASGAVVTQTRQLLPTSRTTIRVDEIEGLEAAEFATVVTSTSGLPIVVERTMRWDATGYGAHTEKASEEGLGLTRYFAEGAQNDYFKTYLLLANTGSEPNVAHITWLREGESALTIDYPLEPTARRTVDAGAEPELVGRSFGAFVTFDRPGMAERAMYFGTNPIFSGGHASSGAAAPSQHWLLAEGATGSFFSTFVLLANPGPDATAATVTFLPDTGLPITRELTLQGFERRTLNIADQDPTLISAAVATQVDSALPLIVERSQYWPNGGWYEAHNSTGVTAAARRWGLAEGRVGGASSDQTFVLLANSGTLTAEITLRFLRVDGTTVTKSLGVGPTSRATVSISGPDSDVPELANEHFGVVIESTQPIVVERAFYSSVNGVLWAAGTNATATRLP